MKCRECNNKTNEFLVLGRKEKGWLGLKWESSQSHYLCREHLIQGFQQEFLAAAQKMIVVDPDIEKPYGTYQYYYATLGEIKKGYAPDKKSTIKSSRLLKNRWQ